MPEPNPFYPPSVDAGLPHEDGVCFALAPEVYPTHYKWCSQQYGQDFGVPFACDVTPPEESCAPLYQGGTHYPDRFCCCDPTLLASCDFYR